MPSPEHDEVVTLLRAVRAEAGTEPPTIEASRSRMDATADFFPMATGVEVQPFEVEGIPCERYLPAPESVQGTILYLHGGAYVSGSLRSHRPFCARLAAAAGMPIVAVGYRLAPEHPHPAALDDAIVVYRWLLSQDHDPASIIIAGDSAGGGLAAATVLSLQAGGTPLPAGAVLISPWLDLTLSSDSITEVAAADPALVASTLAAHATAYAGTDLRSPLASPVFARPDDLAAMPPVLLLVGTADILVGEGRTFAARASAAGAHVDLDVGEDLIHVWPYWDGVPEATEALVRIGTWVRSTIEDAAPSYS